MKPTPKVDNNSEKSTANEEKQKKKAKKKKKKKNGRLGVVVFDVAVGGRLKPASAASQLLPLTEF